MDEDLEHLTESQLIAQVKRLRAGIREHRDSTGHDLCWHHPKLWGLLPEQVTPDLAVPAWPQFLRGCLRYRESLDAQLPNAPRLTEEYEKLDKPAASSRFQAHMIAVDFSTMSELQHKEELVTMMQALYAEDKSDFPVDQSRFGLMSSVSSRIRHRDASCSSGKANYYAATRCSSLIGVTNSAALSCLWMRCS